MCVEQGRDGKGIHTIGKQQKCQTPKGVEGDRKAEITQKTTLKKLAQKTRR